MLTCYIRYLIDFKLLTLMITSEITQSSQYQIGIDSVPN